ncbi:helix-turn-helix transcriptional regulator [Aeromonas hydrophila]|uniref:helix-turn-helix transcriptional regulator n=1 Tax=Aeromonas hydrophila TaxID=644 RepID=UPI000760A188|nr:AraC family transcriptional regulator [Aeromonas hydrophila]KWR66443.1 AraC family transcriptional regulator [Aeromonas hydrophila]HAU4929672.1 AraC family transcriptional regulator [Aeromonas hydrophila]
MNQIDQLISQAGIQGTFDVRCLYRGGFRLPHEQSPAGVMPFHLLMKGEIRVSTAQGDDVVLRPGDLLLLPGGEPHTIWREGDTLALAEPGDGLLPLRGDGGDQVEFLCGEYRYQGPLRPLLLDALPSPLCIPLLASESQQALSLVLSLIHQELLREQQGSGAVLTALSQVLLAMLADPAHPWSVDELAALAAMSRATYFRHFRQRLGCSVWEFMVRVRMVRAAELLRHPDQLPLGEVAQRVGYQSEASFAKAFKQSSGMAPGRFRQQGWPALPG